MRNLLVVDDRADVCEVIAAHLREGGDAVTVASDGATARLLLARNRYDLAIIDVLMPGEGGIALAGLAEARGMAVLLMSGHPASMEPPPGREHCPLLRKPFRFSELDAALAALVTAAPG